MAWVADDDEGGGGNWGIVPPRLLIFPVSFTGDISANILSGWWADSAGGIHSSCWIRRATLYHRRPSSSSPTEATGSEGKVLAGDGEIGGKKLRKMAGAPTNPDNTISYTIHNTQYTHNTHTIHTQYTIHNTQYNTQYTIHNTNDYLLVLVGTTSTRSRKERYRIPTDAISIAP